MRRKYLTIIVQVDSILKIANHFIALFIIFLQQKKLFEHVLFQNLYFTFYIDHNRNDF